MQSFLLGAGCYALSMGATAFLFGVQERSSALLKLAGSATFLGSVFAMWKVPALFPKLLMKQFALGAFAAGSFPIPLSLILMQFEKPGDATGDLVLLTPFTWGAAMLLVALVGVASYFTPSG
ncbi:MAG: hypothetical protein MHM6MM_007049 [Cercozoa sp. M6MM]